MQQDCFNKDQLLSLLKLNYYINAILICHSYSGTHVIRLQLLIWSLWIPFIPVSKLVVQFEHITTRLPIEINAHCSH